MFAAEHGGHGEEPRVFPAGGATRAEEGDGNSAEEDPHGHSKFSLCENKWTNVQSVDTY